MIIDMFCHWSYVLEECSGRVERCRRQARPTSRPAGTSRVSAYAATADDAAYALSSSTADVDRPAQLLVGTRVYRDELVEFQVDGTHGSAVAGLNECGSSSAATTPEAGLEPRPPDPSRSARTGARYRTTSDSTTASRPSGSCSCAMSSRAGAFPFGTSVAGAAGSSSPSSGCSPRAGAADDGRAGDRNVSLATRPELILPAADGSLAPYSLGPGPSLPSPTGADHAPGRLAAAHVVADPAAPATGGRAGGDRLGRDPGLPAGIFGPTAWGSPTRWTPPSAGWA